MLVRTRLRPAQLRVPQGRAILVQRAAARRLDKPSEPDLRRHYFPAQLRSRLQNMGCLFAAERHGHIRAYRRPRHGACIATNARRHINRDDPDARSIHLLDGKSRLARQRPGKPRAKQPIEHDIIRREPQIFQRLPRAIQPRKRVLSLKGPLAFWRKIEHPDIAPKVPQPLRRDESISAIVPRSREHDDAPLGKFGVQDIGTRLPSLLHQSPQRNPRLHRHLLGGTDFFAGKDGGGHLRHHRRRFRPQRHDLQLAAHAG